MRVLKRSQLNCFLFQSRSHLDLPAAVPEEMVQSGFVFETVDKFNAYARGMVSIFRAVI